MAENWELGSNYSVGLGTFSGLRELADNLNKFVQNLSGPIMREALWAGAEVIKSAMESATPVGSEYDRKSASGKTYKVKDRHPGQAKRSVIIYQRAAKTYNKGTFYTALTQSAFVEGVGTTSLLVGYEKEHAYYMYFVEHGYTPHRAGDIVVRTRAGGKSVTKHFRPEDLWFGKSPSKKHGWTRKHFGAAAAKLEATGGGQKVPGRPLPLNVEATMAAAQRAVEQVLQNSIGRAA